MSNLANELSDIILNNHPYMWQPLMKQAFWGVHAELNRIKNQKDTKDTTMKPFNIEEAKAGKPVCTRDGRDVEILKYDLNNRGFPILAVIHPIITDRGSDIPAVYTKEGRYTSTDPNIINELDLMMKSEKKEG